MTEIKTPMYENHLKPGYAVEAGSASIIITAASCYRLPEETLWLVRNLPDKGGRNEYFQALSAMGLEYPRKIFDKLISLGVLREAAPGKFLSSAFKQLIQPNIRLISSEAQERIANFLGLNKINNFKRPVCFLVIAGFLGLAGGAAILKTWHSGGSENGLLVFLLIIIGTLIHELGHSFSAGAAGIGLRPIGFSVYLFYPVFYTNVSGMEKLDIKHKMAIDCGGFIAQSAYLFLLTSLAMLTGSVAFAEAVKWIVLIMAFNINPLLRTDAYWIYSDLREEYGGLRWMEYLHKIYLVAFTAFSVYVLWRVFCRADVIADTIYAAFEKPSILSREGYNIMIGLYFLVMAFMGGMRRIQEGHAEWHKLKEIRQEGV